MFDSFTLMCSSALCACLSVPGFLWAVAPLQIVLMVFFRARGKREGASLPAAFEEAQADYPSRHRLDWNCIYLLYKSVILDSPVNDKSRLVMGSSLIIKNGMVSFT